MTRRSDLGRQVLLLHSHRRQPLDLRWDLRRSHWDHIGLPRWSRLTVGCSLRFGGKLEVGRGVESRRGCVDQVLCWTESHQHDCRSLLKARRICCFRAMPQLTAYGLPVEYPPAPVVLPYGFPATVLPEYGLPPYELYPWDIVAIYYMRTAQSLPFAILERRSRPNGHRASQPCSKVVLSDDDAV